MHKKSMYKAVVAIAVAVALLVPGSAVFANELNGEAIVSISPSTQTVNKGEAFTFSVYVEPGVTPIQGIGFRTLFFDQTLIYVDSIAKGDIVDPDTWVTFIFGDIDNDIGEIGDTVGAVLPDDAITTPGSFIVVSCHALQQLGTSDLVLYGVDVSDVNADPIPTIVNNGEVIVNGEEFYILDISIEGSGTTDPLPGTYSYIDGTVVDLKAIPDLGWSFGHWVGDVADPNSATTTITMNANKTVIAYFTEDHYILTVSTVGNGHVDVDPDKEFYLYGEEPQLTAVADPDWTFDSWSGDLSGNTNPTTIFMDGNKDVTATFTEEEDTIPPVTTCILDPEIPDGDNGWYVSVVTVTLVATDEGSGVESTWYRLNGGYWKLYTDKPFVVSGEGYHKIEYYSFDYDRNKEDINTIEFKIDAKSPLTMHEFDGLIGKEGWFVTNVIVTLNAEDATSGVNYTKYKLDDGIWMNYTVPFNVTEDGEYTLRYYSVDLAGNIEPENEVAFKIEHDTIPPVTTHEFSGIIGDNGWYTSNVAVTLTAVDDSAGVDYTMYKLKDDTEWQKYTESIIVTEDGEHTIKYYSVDKVGNEETVKGPFPFKIDQTKPTIVLAAEKTGLLKWLLIADVIDETSGIAKVEFYVAGEHVGTATDDPYQWTYSGTKGPAQAIAFDKAGNQKISNKVKGQSQSSSSTSVTHSQLFVLG